MNPTILRRVQKVLLTLGLVVTAMCPVLIVACFRNDAQIEANKATVTADVVYADRLHANAYFQTPDGSVHSPRLGLLYPTELTAGQRIRVDYSTANPDLAKPTGRSAVLSIVPAVSVAVLGWIVVAALMLGVAEFSRRWARRRAARRAARNAADDQGSGDWESPDSDVEVDSGAVHSSSSSSEVPGAGAAGTAAGPAPESATASDGSAAQTSRGVSGPDTSAEVAGNLTR
ncbi:hypothetical protein [Gordonia otitidis]